MEESSNKENGSENPRYNSSDSVGGGNGSGSSSSITTNGTVAYDTDGSGQAHNDPDYTNKTSLTNPDGSPFNADTQPYGVAPKNLSTNNGGPLGQGSTETIIANGQTNTIPIGDFGPNGQNGEMSLAAGKSLGLGVFYSTNGPIPTQNGSSPNIPVQVIYHP